MGFEVEKKKSTYPSLKMKESALSGASAEDKIMGKIRVEWHRLA